MTGRVRAARAVQLGSFFLLLFLLPASKAAIEIAFPLLLAGWAAERAWSGGWRSSVWSRASLRPVLISLVAYLSACVLSIVTSTDPTLSLRGFAFKTLEYALFAVVVADIAAQLAPVTLSALVLLASAAMIGVDAIFQEIAGYDFLLHHAPTIYGRMTGPYENPGDLATYLGVLLLLALSLVSWNQPGRRTITGWGLGALIAMLGGCFVRAESQSAWIGFAVGAGLLAGFQRQVRTLLAGLGAALLLGATVLLHAEGRLAAAATFSDVGIKDRMVMWQTGWNMFLDRPILGQGLNTFMANYMRFWVGGERTPRYAHNCYLQVAAETGIIGLVTYLAFFWCLFAALGIGLRRQQGPERFLVAGLMAGLAAFAVQAAADTNFYALRQATLFWVLAGLALGLTERMNPARAAGLAA